MNLIDRFRVLAGGLDHPEGVCWDPDANVLYAGGEAGQLYRISLDGAVEQVASTGGFLLGVAVDGDGSVYGCDVAAGAVVRIDPRTGEVTRYADTDAAGDRMRAPNWLAFDSAGRLFVTDSGDWGKAEGRIWVVEPDRTAHVWTDAVARLPNGCCLTAAEDALLVIETNGPGVVRVPIDQDGSAGEPEPFVDLPGTVPDGIALCADGSVLVSCQRPDRIYRVAAGIADTLVDDPTGQLLGAPANVAWVGPRRDRLATSNLGRWHVAIGDLAATDLRGVPLPRPRLRARATSTPTGTATKRPAAARAATSS